MTSGVIRVTFLKLILTFLFLCACWYAAFRAAKNLIAPLGFRMNEKCSGAVILMGAGDIPSFLAPFPAPRPDKKLPPRAARFRALTWRLPRFAWYRFAFCPRFFILRQLMPHDWLQADSSDLNRAKEGSENVRILTDTILKLGEVSTMPTSLRPKPWAMPVKLLTRVISVSKTTTAIVRPCLSPLGVGWPVEVCRSASATAGMIRDGDCLFAQAPPGSAPSVASGRNRDTGEAAFAQAYHAIPISAGAYLGS